MPPIGAASGGEPTSPRTRSTSSSTSSTRSPCPRPRSCESITETSPTGSFRCAARTETRGRSGVIGMSPMCSSTRVGSFPDQVEIDAGIVADPGECLRERLRRNPVGRERDGVDGTRDQVGARAGRLQGKVPARCDRPPWQVEADRQARQLAELGDELAGTMGLEQPGGGRRAGSSRRRSRAVASPSRRAIRAGCSRTAAPRRTRTRPRSRPPPRPGDCRRRSAGRGAGRPRCRSERRSP